MERYMRALLTVGALALFSLAQPATAQMMCGPGQQAQASTPAQSGMACGMMGQAADDPMADKSEQKPQAQGMCPCCRNMAMMRGRGTMQHHNMPGMDAPKQ
jgi:hypothetical protein